MLGRCCCMPLLHKLDINNAAECRNMYCAVGNFRGRKILHLLSFVAICESFLCKIWGHGIHWWRQWAIHKSVLHKMYVQHRHVKQISCSSSVPSSCETCHLNCHTLQTMHDSSKDLCAVLRTHWLCSTYSKHAYIEIRGTYETSLFWRYR